MKELLNEGLEAERLDHEKRVKVVLLEKHKEVQAAKAAYEKLDNEYKAMLRTPVAGYVIPTYHGFTHQELGRAMWDGGVCCVDVNA